MNDKEKKGFRWLEKLKKVKHIEIYVAILFIVILFLIYFSNYNKTSKNNSTTSNDLLVTTYVTNLEENLEEILSNIGGVKNVKVMITLNMNKIEVTDSKINLNQFPEIKGVIVTAEGVENTSTKLKVLHAIQAVLDITNGNIEILSSK